MRAKELKLRSMIKRIKDSARELPDNLEGVGDSSLLIQFCRLQVLAEIAVEIFVE